MYKESFADLFLEILSPVSQKYSAPVLKNIITSFLEIICPCSQKYYHQFLRHILPLFLEILSPVSQKYSAPVLKNIITSFLEIICPCSQKYYHQFLRHILPLFLKILSPVSQKYSALVLKNIITMLNTFHSVCVDGRTRWQTGEELEADGRCLAPPRYDYSSWGPINLLFFSNIMSTPFFCHQHIFLSSYIIVIEGQRAMPRTSPPTRFS